MNLPPNLLTLLLPITFLLLSATAAPACSCEGPGTVASELQGADAVLRGTVVSKKVVSGTYNLVEVRLAVSTFFKTHHPRTDTVTIYTTWGDSDCGFGVYFHPDKEYIVYGYLQKPIGAWPDAPAEERGYYWALLCTRTTRYPEREAAAIAAVLGREGAPAKK